MPKEVRDYHENIFFGLNTRQFICSVLAVGIAVGIYFALQPYVGTEEIGWMCILGAAPFAACGVFNVVAARQRKLVSHKTFFEQVHCDSFRHLAYDEASLVIRIRTLQNLPGADAVRLRPVSFDILHPARFPAPGVVDEQLRVDTEHLITQLLVAVFVRPADGAF